MIDLRSDTVTKPTPEMRRAMAEAEVGDDVYQEDPTVNRLEETAAKLSGKEAALFVPTGTMANTIAIKLHTEHGEEVICDSRSHILNYELAMMAWFAGCLARPIATDNGLLSSEQIEREIRPPGPHRAQTGLIEIENTHNMAGGTVYPMEVVTDICDRAHNKGLPVHMDGARIFNASIALGISVDRLAASADTLMFCLSKALGAPVGSLLVGPRKLIDKGRLYRKRLGGGMRQAGVLAAAGLIALQDSPAKLAQDHANAKLLARGLAGIPGIKVDADQVQTNIVIFDISGTGLDSGAFSMRLKERGVLANGVGSSAIRMVTHYDVKEAMCRDAIEAAREVGYKTAKV
jgi:threonine aldolase